jgi:hypothetical protein
MSWRGGAQVRRHAGRFASTRAHAWLLGFPVFVRFDRERNESMNERTAVAPVHTIVRHGGFSALHDELLHPFRPFIDSAYARRDDDQIAAIVRAWPGPNATSAIHGELVGVAGR